jgi:hypothetical protein
MFPPEHFTFPLVDGLIPASALSRPGTVSTGSVLLDEKNPRTHARHQPAGAFFLEF